MAPPPKKHPRSGPIRHTDQVRVGAMFQQALTQHQAGNLGQAQTNYEAVL